MSKPRIAGSHQREDPNALSTNIARSETGTAGWRRFGRRLRVRFRGVVPQADRERPAFSHGPFEFLRFSGRSRRGCIIVVTSASTSGGSLRPVSERVAVIDSVDVLELTNDNLRGEDARIVLYTRDTCQELFSYNQGQHVPGPNEGIAQMRE
jgi:hypothetical protein